MHRVEHPLHAQPYQLLTAIPAFNETYVRHDLDTGKIYRKDRTDTAIHTSR